MVKSMLILFRVRLSIYPIKNPPKRRLAGCGLTCQLRENTYRRSRNKTSYIVPAFIQFVLEFGETETLADLQRY